MQTEQTKQPSLRDEEPLAPVRKDLSSLWMGSDHNVASTFLNGTDGKLEQLWVSALSERGLERFVYSNQTTGDLGHFNEIPKEVGEQISHLYQPIVERTRTLTDSMADLSRVFEPSASLGFWTEQVGDDMFELPAGLKTKQAVALMPTFEAFCKDPTLGRNLFAVATDRFNVGVFISEKENFSLIAFMNSVYKIPGTEVPAGSLRDFTFAHASLLVDGLYEQFYRGVGQFKVVKNWEQAGGPPVMIATKTDSGAELSTFRIQEGI